MILRLIVCLIACLFASERAVAQDNANAAREEFFETKIRPVLAEKCVSCHGPDKQEGGVRLDMREFLTAKQEFGTALVPGKPDKSRLMEVIAWSDDDVQMPPSGKLPDESRAAFAKWIADGAFWPDSQQPLVDPFASKWKTHWAFQPVKRAAPPQVQDKSQWVRNNTDRFVLKKLEAAGISPSPRADARTLARRVSFAVIGLPPSNEQIEKLSADFSQAGFSRLVDELLASPHFGERWGRYWLDIARYSDTRGYVFTSEREYKQAYTYRDWVMNSLNADMPFDQFLIQQIAADKVVPADDGAGLAATGFLTLGRRFLNNTHDIIDDRIDVVTRGTLGLTVSCARCHDHKYDPIPTADYYSLYGVFASSKEPGKGASELRLEDLPNPVNPVVFERGSPGRRGKAVPRQFLAVLSKEERKPFTNGSGRLELAQAIASPNNPLTARVFVNRVWAHLFGNGLVRTPSDFGLRSDPPTHPQLLDYLAGSFMDNGWSVKSLIREILLSATWQQSSRVNPDVGESDPENRLLARMNRRRLDFEAHRDALLSASGRLDRKTGGPSVKITSAPYSNRRTFYAYIDRQNLPNVFRTFDFASPDTHSPQRYNTTVPQRALYQLNHPFVQEQAAALAEQFAKPAVSEERIQALFQGVLQRQPTAAEMEFATDFVNPDQPENSASSPIWQYGSGTFDEANQRLQNFAALAFHKDTWQPGPIRPDPKRGWLFVNAKGGHPGYREPSVRRFNVPASGRLEISGQLKHPSKNGDGVRGRIVSSRAGVLGTWTVLGSSAATNVASLDVVAGDTIDFVTDCVKTSSFDSFDWRASISITGRHNDHWHTERDFRSTMSPPPDAWTRLAQVLLISNEFVFVD